MAVSPFRNILRLSAGEFLGKAFYFAAVVYMARILGVDLYGVLEFSVTLKTYLLFAADGGLETWAVREAAKGRDIREIAGRLLPVRVLLAVVIFLVLLGGLQALPEQRYVLKIMLTVFGLTLFTQAVNLKWAFLGAQKMSRVALGLVLSQVVFASLTFAFVDRPGRVFVTPWLFLAGEVVASLYFWLLFASHYGGRHIPLTFHELRQMIRPAFALGASHALSLMNYNIDSILLGLIRGPMHVGWYAAAYKPVTALLAFPVSYFSGFFPALTQARNAGRKAFRSLIARSLHLTAIAALPFGVGGSLLAGPIIVTLFGDAYRNSIPVFQILSWSVVLVTIRGNFRHGLNASGGHRLDLRCGLISVSCNLAVNLALIPQYGMVGAAVATLCSEAVWLVTAYYLFSKHVGSIPLLPALWRPAIGSAAMAAIVMLMQGFAWPLRAGAGGLAYCGVLVALGDPEIKSLAAKFSQKPPEQIPVASEPSS